jgi:hypothetical protein
VFRVRYEHYLHIKCKAILVRNRGGLYWCEILRIPHCLDKRLKMAMRMLASRIDRSLRPRNIFTFVSGTHFCKRMSMDWVN